MQWHSEQCQVAAEAPSISIIMACVAVSPHYAPTPLSSSALLFFLAQGYQSNNGMHSTHLPVNVNNSPVGPSILGYILFFQIKNPTVYRIN